LNCPDEESHGDEYRRLEYCSDVPRAYVTTLCGASIVQYISQQVMLPQHEGFSVYISHFVDFKKKRPYYIFTRLVAVKIATVFGILALALFPDKLQALDILLIMLAITLVQGLTQTVENMVVHVAQLEAKNKRRHRRPLYERAVHKGWKRLGFKKTGEG
jgi:hypothetical protein